MSDFEPERVEGTAESIIQYLKENGITGYEFVTESKWKVKLVEKEK